MAPTGSWSKKAIWLKAFTTAAGDRSPGANALRCASVWGGLLGGISPCSSCVDEAVPALWEWAANPASKAVALMMEAIRQVRGERVMRDMAKPPECSGA